MEFPPTPLKVKLNTTYLIMEFCRGGDFRGYLEDKKTLSEYVIRQFFRQIVSGLKFLHDRNIVHRDLKPENILLSFAGKVVNGNRYPTPKNIILKIADFGVSRFLSSDDVASTECGTFVYMAPEILQRKPYGKEVDVWSIGIMVHECLTGKIPKPPYDNSELPAKLSKEIRALVQKLMAHEPQERLNCEQILVHEFMRAKEQAVNAPIVSGGSTFLESLRMDNVVRFLKPLPGFVELTYEPCMITLDDDPRTARAKMPCGHVISTKAMMEYCEDIIREGRVKFPCPHHACLYEWDYSLVRRVACLTDIEMQAVEKRLADNFLNSKGLQKCPRCQFFCYRPQGVKNCVRCPICTNSLGRNYDFCWICLNELKLNASLISCGNQGCNGKDIKIQILAMCKTKVINGKECPSIRACPNCGLLIEHREGCSRMSCPNCPEFCFLCLKEKGYGRWKCRLWADSCPVAPRQTETE